ncbi:hypothetical protein NDU88_004760 [Pleurodeles waltl]|uniref:Uncharacterized protein n=1 Tax=Pleurodeles waltl TaxID=8319 RepID=A0AAV7RHS0_PLEWA|nr:hypothetical protein NDU88_004760 [Pleurodeles waltl]
MSNCDGPLQTATDPPDIFSLTDPAVPDPEGEDVSTNPLQHPGAKGQSQRLPWLNPEAETERGNCVEGSLTGSRGDAAERTTRHSTPERPTGSRGDTTNNRGAGIHHGDPKTSTSGAGCTQQEFWPRLGISVAFPGAWQH